VVSRLLLVAAIVLVGPVPASSAATRAPSLPPLHAAPDADSGGRIVDARGREVLLRGVNVNALAEYWQGTPLPTVFPLEARDPRRMAAIGWNAVRLLISWSRVEPRPGEYDEAYLNEAVATAARLRAEGIYTIVDLHQDAWGPSLAAREGEVCPPGSERARGWDGAPEWATLDGGLPRCAAGGIREASPAVYRSWQAFWADQQGSGGVGIQTRYVAMLRHVARRFARVRGIAGYDMMNEPNAFGEQDESRLSQMYSRALREIRAGEREGGGPRRLVLFEPSALWSATGSGAPPDFDRDRDVVYAPHVYTGGFDDGPITRQAFRVARDEAEGFDGAPVLSGEWGSSPKRAQDPGDPYFLDHQRFQDEFRFSATLWTWRESCGDPHLGGGSGSPWGEWEVACPANTVSGMRRALVRQLTRAYVRAAPGRILGAAYDDASGDFSARGAGSRRRGELVAFYPREKHGGMHVRTTGLRDVRSRAAPGGGRLIVGSPVGGQWSISVRPR
jgi:endoglycosylceramidase